MAKYKPGYWRKDEPEPTDFAVESDPLHGGAFEAGRYDLIAYAKEATDCIKIWLEDHSRNLDAMLNAIKERWFAAGGEGPQWETIIAIAYRDSNYAKLFSKEANAAIRDKPSQPPPKFNGLDFSALE